MRAQRQRARRSFGEKFLEQLNPSPRISTWVQTYQITADLVCSGEGLALVDPFTAVSAGAELQIRVVEPVMPIDLWAVYRIDSPLNSVPKSFVHYVKSLGGDSSSIVPTGENRLHSVI